MLSIVGSDPTFALSLNISLPLGHCVSMKGPISLSLFRAWSWLRWWLAFGVSKTSVRQVGVSAEAGWKKRLPWILNRANTIHWEKDNVHSEDFRHRTREWCSMWRTTGILEGKCEMNVTEYLPAQKTGALLKFNYVTYNQIYNDE